MQALDYSDIHKADVPEALIYETSGGMDIYYCNYMDYLRGEKSIEELMGSSYLQAFVIMKIVRHLLLHLPDTYHVFSNELGVIDKEGNRRAIDIAVYTKESLKDIPMENKYLRIPPEIAIEMDTKADTGNFSTAMDYVYEKTDDLLGFGVKKVIWFFSSSRKAMIASATDKWITVDWKEAVPIMENIEINLHEMLKEK